MAAGDADLGLTVSGADLESTAGGYAWICCICIADDSLDECGEGTRVTEVQRGGDRDNRVGRCGGNRDN